ncbi:MAG: Ig-like domain-containing protein [Burkholderiaceae bacterium]|nr:Ig-like domain-containing protein [Burkholderiaceae bacterium]
MNAPTRRRHLLAQAPRALALEARLMFDAAAVADAVQTLDTRESPQPETAPGGQLIDRSAISLSGDARQHWQAATTQLDALLRDLVGRPDFGALISGSFGAPGSDPELLAQHAADISEDILGRGLGIAVELRSGRDLQGAYAAYTAKSGDGQERIYVNADWIARGASEAQITRVLLEEVGHALDHRINAGVDTQGDEGALFAALASGRSLTETQRAFHLADADQGELLIDGSAVQVEFAELSVPFPEGFIGTRGTSNNAADNVLNFSTLGITRASFFQDSGTGSFTAQGNDIPGGIRLTLNSGQVITINGAINWRETSGQSLYAFGFIPDASTAPVSFTYGAGQTFTISNQSNFGLELVGVNYSVADGSDVNGNAATTGLLEALNSYLTQVRANDPNGPVTVDSLSTTDTTPTLSGAATLGAGETLSVLVDGRTYTTANGLTVGGGTWSLTIPDAQPLSTGTYSVTATITNSSGYTLTDTTSSELVIQGADSTPPTASIVVADTALAVGETSLVTITFSEAVTGFTNADLTVDNGTLSNVASADGGITWTATFTPTAGIQDTSNLITLANSGLTDAAGNAGSGTTASNNYAIDTLRPTASIVVADTALAVGETSLVTITFSEAVTGFTNADLTVDNGSLSAVSSADGGITWTATFTPTAGIEDTSNLITLANSGLTDAAGNAGSGSTDSNTYAIDTYIVITGPSGVPGDTTGSLSIAEGITAITQFTATEPVTWTISGGADAAKFSIDSNGNLAFVSAPDFEAPTDAGDTALNNTYVVEVQAEDAAGNVSTQTVTVSVTDVDDSAPVITGPSGGAGAASSARSVAEGTTAVTQLTASEAVTWSISGGADAAKFSIDASGNLSFVSAPDFETPTDAGDTALNNTYVVEVQAEDAAGNVSTQTVTVSVTDVDDTAPVITGPSGGAGAASSAQSVPEGTTAVTQLTATEPVTWTISGGADAAKFSIDSNGNLAFVSAPDFEAPTDAGDTALNNTYVVEVQAEDAAGNVSTQTVTVSVTDVDDSAPAITAGQVFSYPENQSSGAILGTVAASDAVGVTAFRFADSGSSTSADGFFSIDNSGVIRLTAAGATAATASNDFETSPNSFTLGVQAADAAGNWSSATDVTLEVTNVDDTAPQATPDSETVDEDTPITIDVLANDVAGGSGPLTLLTASIDPSEGTVAIVANQIVFTPAANFNGTASITYVATNGTQDSAPTLALVTVVPVNDLPVVGNPSDPDWDADNGRYLVSTPEDTPRSGRIAAADVDGHTPSFSTTTGPAHGSVVLDPATGAWTYTPAANFHGSDSFVVSVSDGNGGSTSVTVVVEVTPVNDTPVPESTTARFSTFQDSTWSGQLPAAEDRDGHALRYLLAEPPAHGTVEVDAQGRYRYVPADGFHGQDRFEVRIDDGAGGVATIRVQVDVIEAPTITLPAESDLGISDSDRVTSADRISLAGSAPPNQTLNLYAPDGQRLATVVTDADGRWRVDGLNIASMVGDAGGEAGAPGTYRFTLRPVDADGREGAEVALPVIRELPPAPPATDAAPPAASDTGSQVEAPASAPAASNASPFDSALRGSSGGAGEYQPPTTTSEQPRDSGAPGAAQRGNDGDIYTRPSGFRIMVTPASEPSLKLFRGVDDQIVPAGRTLIVQVPADAFIHTQINETISLTATLADGRPLPGWLMFDGKTGKFVGQPPDGVLQDLAIQVTASDSQGRKVTTMFRIKVSDGSSSSRSPLSLQLMRREALALDRGGSPAERSSAAAGWRAVQRAGSGRG